MMKAGIGIAAVFFILSIILGSMHGDNWKRFFHAYVIGWCFVVSIPIGMLWIVLLHHLVRGRWVTAVRRLCESMTLAFPIVTGWIVWPSSENGARGCVERRRSYQPWYAETSSESHEASSPRYPASAATTAEGSFPRTKAAAEVLSWTQPRTS